MVNEISELRKEIKKLRVSIENLAKELDKMCELSKLLKEFMPWIKEKLIEEALEKLHRI